MCFMALRSDLKSILFYSPTQSYALFFFCTALVLWFSTQCDWMNWSFRRGHGFLLAHRMCPCVSAGCWYMIQCWHRLPWERKRDKEMFSLTSNWTLSRTVGISFRGEMQKMDKLHVGSHRDYRELKNRRVRAVKMFCLGYFGWNSDTLLFCSWTVRRTMYIKLLLFFWLISISWRASGVFNKVEQSVSAQWLDVFAEHIQIWRQENADKSWVVFIDFCQRFSGLYFFLCLVAFLALLKLLLLQ